MSKNTTAARANAPGMTEFLRALEQRGHEPALDRTSGTVRFDLDRNGRVEHWRLEIRRGAVTVSRGSGPADGVIKAQATVLDDLASGRANAMASMLRGAISYEGDPGLLVHVQRLFPSPTARKMVTSNRTVGRRRG
jgi:hypothetical protein